MTKCPKCDYSNTPPHIKICNYCGIELPPEHDLGDEQYISNNKLLKEEEEQIKNISLIFKARDGLSCCVKKHSTDRHTDGIIIYITKSEMENYTGDLSCSFSEIKERYSYYPYAVKTKGHDSAPTIWMEHINVR